jgi:hypothetical protein
MLKKCLENIGEGLLYACISSYKLITLMKIQQLRFYGFYCEIDHGSLHYIINNFENVYYV